MGDRRDDDPPQDGQGTRLGNYVLGERLAAGGMAELFSAHSLERRFETPIVLKRMLPHLAKSRSFVDMFIDEARISTRLDHPNIVHVYDFEATRNGLCLVMELVDGPDLLAVLKRCSKLGKSVPQELAVYIACHVLEALDYAHRVTTSGRCLDIVHRDVTPSNILLTRRGQVKLADFGIARAAERQHATATGTLKGKYAYMSPEQILGRDLDGRSDVFSMSIVLAEMLMGRRLFGAPGDLDVLLMVRRADLTRLDKYGTQIHPKLVGIVRKALARKRNHRFATAGDFRDALANWLARSSRRSGASRLVEFLDALEEHGGSLCKWQARAGSAGSSPTLSGRETQLARIALNKAAQAGRHVFALGAAPPYSEAESVQVQDFALEPYDGSADIDPTLRDRGSSSSHLDSIPLAGGSLDKVPALELLCAIAHRRLTGLLLIKSGEFVKEAFFREGHPEFVRSNLPEERFGQFLVRRGVLTRKQLERVLAALPHFGGRMGQALVALDLLKPVDAVHLLAEQVAHKLIDACALRRGRFLFRPGVRNPWPALALHLNTFEIVGRALSSLRGSVLSEWGKKHGHEMPVVNASEVDEFAFDAELHGELAALDGKRGLLEVAQTVPPAVNRLRFLAAAYLLWRCGTLELRPPQTEARRSRPTRSQTAYRSGKRKYPRARARCSGSMQLRRGTGQHTVLVTILSVACEGLGLRVIGDEYRHLRRGEQVLVRFSNGREELEVPGQIAWCADNREGRELDVGVKLQLALAEASMREAYASWAVEVISASRTDDE